MFFQGNRESSVRTMKNASPTRRSALTSMNWFESCRLTQTTFSVKGDDSSSPVECETFGHHKRLRSVNSFTSAKSQRFSSFLLVQTNVCQFSLPHSSPCRQLDEPPLSCIDLLLDRHQVYPWQHKHTDTTSLVSIDVGIQSDHPTS